MSAKPVPYHQAITEFLDLIDVYDDYYPKRLSAIAELAQTVIVPEEHRPAVGEAFKKQVGEIRQYWDEKNHKELVNMCREICTAMGVQVADEDTDG